MLSSADTFRADFMRHPRPHSLPSVHFSAIVDGARSVLPPASLIATVSESPAETVARRLPDGDVMA